MKIANPFPSYAQYNEDIVLLALLSDVKKGFYVDVGANYPSIDSVTKLFYEKGWSGINIEPIPSLFRMLQEDRPNDINLCIGIGDRDETVDFFENETVPGHSSFNKDMAVNSKSDKINTYKVEIKTLESVFRSNNVGKINFLKIDVEGLEDAVISGNDWSIYRPDIICIEANHKETPWQIILIKNKYKLFINDGLNEFYIAEELWSITDDFADKVVKLAYRSMKKHQYDTWRGNVRQLKKVTLLNQIHFDLVQQLREENHILHNKYRLSLAGVGYLKRLKRSFYGLTVDWVKYKLDGISKKR